MPLVHRSIKSNEVRAPEVRRGEVVIVGRYSEKTPKVALVNPEDLAMLEDTHDTLLAAGLPDALAADELALKTLEIEDQPDATSVEDPEQIAALLEL